MRLENPALKNQIPKNGAGDFAGFRTFIIKTR